MSEQITIAKARKELTLKVKAGEYYILVQPGESYDKHLSAYRKAAQKMPVNDEVSRVCIGKVVHTNPVLNLVTSEEKVKLDEQEEARNDSIEATILSAPDRQKTMEDDRKEKIAEEHRVKIAKKNAMIAQIRKDTWEKDKVAA